MKTLLISITILLALSSTVYADRYRDPDRGYNNHHSSKYESNYGKHYSRPVKYNKHHGQYSRPVKYNKHQSQYSSHEKHHDSYISSHNNDDLPLIILGAGVLGYMIGESF